jgi:hypothetical protein
MKTFCLSVQRTRTIVNVVYIEAKSKRAATKQFHDQLKTGDPDWYDEASWGEVEYYCYDKSPAEPDDYKIIGIEEEVMPSENC